MKLLAVVILVLSFSAALCSVSEIQFQPKNVNYTHLLCLKGLGRLDEFFIVGQLESTETFKFFISSVDFDELEERKLMPHFNISLVDLVFYFSPEVSASYYVATLEKYYVGMLWFDVANTNQAEVTCEKVWTLISTIEYMSQRKIGIIGNKQDWVRKFGSESACSQFSRYPLFYSGFGPFETFAGWKDFVYSKGQSFSNVCGISYDEVIPKPTLTSQ